jgi:hypothetical protein
MSTVASVGATAAACSKTATIAADRKTGPGVRAAALEAARRRAISSRSRRRSTRRRTRITSSSAFSGLVR